MFEQPAPGQLIRFALQFCLCRFHARAYDVVDAEPRLQTPTCSAFLPSTNEFHFSSVMHGQLVSLSGRSLPHSGQHHLAAAACTSSSRRCSSYAARSASII